MAELEKQSVAKKKEDTRMETVHEMERQLAAYMKQSEALFTQVEAQKKQIEGLNAANLQWEEQSKEILRQIH